MTESRVEFAVQLSGEKCSDKVKKSLEGCGQVEIDLEKGRVIILTTEPWSTLQEKIEKTGRRAVLTGYGGQSAVAIVDKGNENIRGVVRFSAVNLSDNGILVDGVLDGLSPGNHKIRIYECGDVSEGCNMLGDVYKPINSSLESNEENLGNITADDTGRSTFRFNDSTLAIWDIIGRSLVVLDNDKKLACGIIARSAGISENFKKICACDGITIWDERDVPSAGGARKNAGKVLPTDMKSLL